MYKNTISQCLMWLVKPFYCILLLQAISWHFFLPKVRNMHAEIPIPFTTLYIWFSLSLSLPAPFAITQENLYLRAMTYLWQIIIFHKSVIYRWSISNGHVWWLGGYTCWFSNHHQAPPSRSIVPQCFAMPCAPLGHRFGAWWRCIPGHTWAPDDRPGTSFCNNLIWIGPPRYSPSEPAKKYREDVITTMEVTKTWLKLKKTSMFWVTAYLFDIVIHVNYQIICANSCD